MGPIKQKPPLPRQLLARAGELRQNATDAEKLLWQLLRNRQLGGAKFRRQHPFGNFILDFYCHEAKLAIELDGEGHTDPEQAHYDATRTEALASEDVQVLRFWNHDVLKKYCRCAANHFGGSLCSYPITLTPTLFYREQSSLLPCGGD